MTATDGAACEGGETRHALGGMIWAGALPRGDIPPEASVAAASVRATMTKSAELRAATAYEARGVAGIHLEDQVHPKALVA